jgi:hypothetical protein
MKTLLTVFIAILLVAGCDKQQTNILDDISGVWRGSDNAMVTISYRDKELSLEIGDQVIPVKIGAIDVENNTINLNLILDTTGKPAIWTLRRIQSADKKSFNLEFTLHDGTHDTLQFVRKISADDLIALNANNPLKIGAAAKAIGKPANTSPITETIVTPDSISGRWKGENSEMVIKPIPTGLGVSINVGAAPLNPDAMGCAGSIQALGTLTGNALTLIKKEDDQVCTISVKFAGDAANIEESNCSAFHGASCDFDGPMKIVK